MDPAFLGEDQAVQPLDGSDIPAVSSGESECVTCGSTAFELSDGFGELVCMSCGTVSSTRPILVNRALDESSTTFFEGTQRLDSSSRSRMTRGGRGVPSSNEDRRHEAKERRIRNAHELINSLARSLQVPTLAEKACFYYNQANAKRSLIADRVTYYAAASLAIVMRDKQRPNTLRMIANSADLLLLRLTRTYVVLQQQLGIGVTEVEPVVYIEKHIVHLVEIIEDSSKAVTDAATWATKGRFKRDPGTLDFIKALDFKDVRTTAISLSAFFSKIHVYHGRHAVTVSAAIVMMAIEASANYRMPKAGDLANEMCKVYSAAGWTAMERYREGQKALLDWSEQLEDYDLSVREVLVSETGRHTRVVDRRLEVAQLTKRVLEEQDHIRVKRRALGLEVPSEISVEKLAQVPGSSTKPGIENWKASVQEAEEMEEPEGTWNDLGDDVSEDSELEPEEEPDQDPLARLPDRPRPPARLPGPSSCSNDFMSSSSGGPLPPDFPFASTSPTMPPPPYLLPVSAAFPINSQISSSSPSTSSLYTQYVPNFRPQVHRFQPATTNISPLRPNFTTDTTDHTPRRPSASPHNPFNLTFPSLGPSTNPPASSYASTYRSQAPSSSASTPNHNPLQLPFHSPLPGVAAFLSSASSNGNSPLPFNSPLPGVAAYLSSLSVSSTPSYLSRSNHLPSSPASHVPPAPQQFTSVDNHDFSGRSSSGYLASTSQSPCKTSHGQDEDFYENVISALESFGSHEGPSSVSGLGLLSRTAGASDEASTYAFLPPRSDFGSNFSSPGPSTNIDSSKFFRSPSASVVSLPSSQYQQQPLASPPPSSHARSSASPAPSVAPSVAPSSVPSVFLSSSATDPAVMKRRTHALTWDPTSARLATRATGPRASTEHDRIISTMSEIFDEANAPPDPAPKFFSRSVMTGMRPSEYMRHRPSDLLKTNPYRHLTPAIVESVRKSGQAETELGQLILAGHDAHALPPHLAPHSTLGVLAALRVGGSDAVRDDELFIDGELEGYMRPDDEVAYVTKTWEEEGRWEGEEERAARKVVQDRNRERAAEKKAIAAALGPEAALTGTRASARRPKSTKATQEMKARLAALTEGLEVGSGNKKSLGKRASRGVDQNDDSNAIGRNKRVRTSLSTSFIPTMDQPYEPPSIDLGEIVGEDGEWSMDEGDGNVDQKVDEQIGGENIDPDLLKIDEQIRLMGGARAYESEDGYESY